MKNILCPSLLPLLFCIIAWCAAVSNCKPFFIRLMLNWDAPVPCPAELLPASTHHFALVTQEIELETRSLLHDRIELLVPKEFTMMPPQLIDLKYARFKNKPTYVLTNLAGSVNIVLNQDERGTVNQDRIESKKNMIRNTLLQLIPRSELKSDGIQMINGRKVGYIKFVTKGIDEDIYNYMALTDVQGKLLTASFNCTVALLPQWDATAEKIVNSLKVK